MPRILYWFLTPLLALLSSVSTAQVALPDIGDPASAVLSLSEERRLGAMFMRELRASLTLVEDPEITAYVDSLGYKLASHANWKGGNFTFFVVLQPSINAFAMPGGYIGINTGLIAASRTEGELASVFAHEIAHVTQRHIARQLELASRQQISSIAGVAASILIGTQSAQAGVAAGTALRAQGIQAQIDFTRAGEKEADRVGMATLARAGYDPRAMPTFFERLQEAYKYYSQPPEFLSTHPVTASRIADSRGRAETYPYKQYSDSLSYHLVKAKIQVYSEEPERALEIFKERVETGNYTSELGARYGYALALLRTRQLAKAREVTQGLIKSEPNRISFYDLMAKIELASNNFNEAIYIYEDNLELYPGDPALTRGYLKALIGRGYSDKAVKVVDRYSKNNEMDAVMYKLAAEAYQGSGQLQGAYANLAEHFYERGQLNSAIHHMELALNQPSGDFYQVSRMQARLEQFQGERRDRQKNQN